MKRLFLFFALLCSLACEEEKTHTPCNELKKPYTKMAFGISDALPIQFWEDGQGSYNLKDIPGIEKPCLCLDLAIGRSIHVEWWDTVNFNYAFIVYDDQQEPIYSAAVTKLPVYNGATFIKNVYSVNFSSSELSAYIGQQIYFRIVTLSGGYLFNTTGALPPSAGAYQEWSNDVTVGNLGGGTIDWTIDDDDLTVYHGVSGSTDPLSHHAIIGVAGVSGGFYTLNYQFLIAAGAGVKNYQVTFSFVNHVDLGGGLEGWTTVFSKTVNITNPGGISSEHNGAISFIAPATFSAVHCQVNMSGTVVFSSIKLQTASMASGFPAAYSDCWRIVNELSNDYLRLQWWDVKNYADLNYQHRLDDGQTGVEYSLDLPASFWKEDFPTTQELHKLTDGDLIQLKAEIQPKRLLEIAHTPAYIHRKLLLAMTHRYFYVDQKYWAKQDGYEREQPNRFALSQAKVWLTEKDIKTYTL